MVNLKPELKKDDRIVCIQMHKETTVKYGDRGTVISKTVVSNIPQYYIDWDNGSRLPLLSDMDNWMLEDDFNKLKNKKKNITEGDATKVAKNSYLFKTVKIVLIDDFLVNLRKSGIVNMYQSAPYLYMGRDRIEHELKYSNKDNEYVDKVLDMADEIQAELINSSIEYLEKQGIEPELNNINRTLRKLSKDIVEMYMNLR